MERQFDVDRIKKEQTIGSLEWQKDGVKGEVYGIYMWVLKTSNYSISNKGL